MARIRFSFVRLCILLLIVAIARIGFHYIILLYHDDIKVQNSTIIKPILTPDLRAGKHVNKVHTSAPNFKQMVFVTVSCGDRFNETSNLIKSAVSLSIKRLTVILFTEKKHMDSYSSMNTQWPSYIKERVKLIVKEATYPEHVDPKKWRSLFRPCASLRLFLPTLLPDVDAILYADIDVVFMTSLDYFWDYFKAMNSTQMAALAPEQLDLATGWYNRFAKHPFYGRLGLNSGVMLMNLTRMRKFSWDEYPEPILEQYHKQLHWGDQDIINIIFHSHPDKVYLMDCEDNFRTEFCKYNINTCKTAEKHGIRAVHGSRLAFTNKKYPAFEAIYQAWNSYNVGEDLRQNLYYPMQKYLLLVKDTYCGKLYETFLKSLKQIVDP